jgi:hypothetical protein
MKPREYVLPAVDRAVSTRRVVGSSCQRVRVSGVVRCVRELEQAPSGCLECTTVMVASSITAVLGFVTAIDRGAWWWVDSIWWLVGDPTVCQGGERKLCDTYIVIYTRMMKLDF